MSGAADHPSPYDLQVSAFLSDYEKTRPQFETLWRATRDACEELLESINIKGVVNGRAKKSDSLEKKLKGPVKDPGLITWISEKKKVSEYPEMWDLAGVRIGVYLPGDISKVANEIEDRFNKIHSHGSVTGERKTTDEKNMDIENHGLGPLRDGDGDFWHNYGYKSWQMVVAWKEDRMHDTLKQLKIQAPEGLKVLNFDSLRVEIQIGTAVTQAWAEIQHNVIYKKPKRVLTTTTMKRMIDATNGLAITTDIMLEELERNLKKAAEEAEARRWKPLWDVRDFLQWFESTYMSEMQPEDRQYWRSRQDMKWAMMLFRMQEVYQRGPTPNELEELMDKEQVLQQLEKLDFREVDISKLILQRWGQVDYQNKVDNGTWKG